MKKLPELQEEQNSSENIPVIMPYKHWEKYFQFPSTGTLKYLLLRRNVTYKSRDSQESESPAEEIQILQLLMGRSTAANKRDNDDKYFTRGRYIFKRKSFKIS